MCLGTRKIAGVSVLLAMSLIAFMLENFLPPIVCLFAGGAATALFTAVALLAMKTYSISPIINAVKGRISAIKRQKSTQKR